MAQLDFYLDKEDKIDLMSLVFSEGGYIIPDLNYSEPAYQLIKDIEGYKSFVDDNILFFIIHESYLKEPLTFRCINKNGHDVYYIPQKSNGPTIDFYSPGLIQKDNTRFIGAGNVSHYSVYFNVANDKNIAVPEELNQFYKKLVKHIKQNSFAIKFSKRTYWIGKNAIDKLRDGYRLIDVPENTLSEFLEFTQA